MYNDESPKLYYTYKVLLTALLLGTLQAGALKSPRTRYYIGWKGVGIPLDFNHGFLVVTRENNFILTWVQYCL